MTQERLGEVLGVSAPAVSRWETGTDAPEDERLPAIADALGTTVDDLLGVISPREKLTRTMALLAAVEDGLLDAGKLLTAIAKASAPRRALILALAYKDAGYLDALPQDNAQAMRAMIKAL